MIDGVPMDFILDHYDSYLRVVYEYFMTDEEKYHLEDNPDELMQLIEDEQIDVAYAYAEHEKWMGPIRRMQERLRRV
jgi:hypothetical protein